MQAKWEGKLFYIIQPVSLLPLYSGSFSGNLFLRPHRSRKEVNKGGVLISNLVKVRIGKATTERNHSKEQVQ